MVKIRKVKTASGKIAVQIVERSGLLRRTKIIKHFGSGSNKAEINNLLILAQKFLFDEEKTNPLFPELFESPKYDLVSRSHIKAKNGKHNFAYEFLDGYYKLNGFDELNNKLLKDLAIMRIVDPCSKLRSISLLAKYFGIVYPKNSLYLKLPLINKLKIDAEKIAVNYARQYLSFDFTLVFFDVTTLYFETFKEDKDNFRKPGFSKDGKHSQPQILVSLVVTKEGYPIAADIFEGNKFEGHTMIPVIENFKNIHNITNLTVVADAGMLSLDNTQKLSQKNLNYIVGARLSNLPLKVVKEMTSCLNKTVGIYFQTETKNGTLICDYSVKRATKNRFDREKQIQKAQDQINSPGKIKKLRFLKQTSKQKFELNQNLIDKQELLDGIKGYLTNLKDPDPKLTISRYKDLWHVEKSFRIAKSDLQTRPIYHHKLENVKAHILIVFVALAISKSIEIKLNKSIQNIKNKIWEIQDIELHDTLTNKTWTVRTDEY
jgi:hypothetical protein